MKYHIFHRTWWKRERDRRFASLVPHQGRKTTIGFADSYEAARDMARVWNANHEPGPLSRKAEFTRVE